MKYLLSARKVRSDGARESDPSLVWFHVVPSQTLSTENIPHTRTCENASIFVEKVCTFPLGTNW